MARRVKTMRGLTTNKPSNAQKTTARVKKAPQPNKPSKPVLGRRPLTRRSAKQGEHLFYRSLDNFSLFPQLPAEIRVQIWRELLPKPRIVTRDMMGFVRGPITKPAEPGLNNSLVKSGSIRRVFHGDKKDPVSQWERNPLFVPAIAHTCQESRSVFLKHYIRLSGEWDSRVDDRKGLVYLNTDQDVLDLSTHTSIALQYGGENFQRWVSVKNVALSLYNISTLHEVHTLIKMLHEQFPAVEKIYIYEQSDLPYDQPVMREFEILLRALFADWKGPQKQEIFRVNGFFSPAQIVERYRSVFNKLDPVSDDATSIKVTIMEDVRQELGMSELPNAIWSWQW